ALLVPDERDRPPVEAAETRHDRGVVRPAAVAVQLDEVVQEALHVVERVRPVGVPRELDGAPDLLVGRLGLQPLELLLQALELGRETGATEERQAPQPPEPPAETELG